MSERYFSGEKIRITIEAEVSDHSGDELEYTYPTALGAVAAVAVLDGSPVTIERGDPEWWPPRPGDLLREGDGLLWFACANGSNVLYRTAWSERMEDEEAWEKRHLLTLVHREDEQDGQDGKAPTAGEEVPERPGRVVGDCGHPVWRAEWDGGERTCQPCQDAFAAEMSGGAAEPSVYEDMGVRDAIRAEIARGQDGGDRG